MQREYQLAELSVIRVYRENVTWTRYFKPLHTELLDVVQLSAVLMSSADLDTSDLTVGPDEGSCGI